MKKFFVILLHVLSHPIVLFCLGLLFMIVPPLIASVKGITSLEPGFSYGVFYGLGISLAAYNFRRLFL